MNSLNAVLAVLAALALLVLLVWWLFHRRREYLGLTDSRAWWLRGWVVRKMAERRWAHIPADLTPWQESGVWYVAFKNVPMLDWDIGEGENKITQAEWEMTVLPSLKRSMVTWRVYRTPGGYRAFVGDMLVPRMHLSTFMYGYRCDPAYVAMTEALDCWTCRVSPKVGREGDYVAEYIGTFGKEISFEPEALRQIRVHDTLIKQHRNHTPPHWEALDLVDSLVRSYWEEPWEEVHRAALHDLYEDWLDEIRPDHVIESDWETRTPVAVAVGGPDQDDYDLPY